MNIETLSFTDLPFSKLFTAYINDFASLSDFFEYHYLKDDDIKKAADNLAYKADRDTLADILTEFNEPFALHERAKENIEALRNPDSLTVTTGQQMMIGGGPLFTVFKTITAIHYARRTEELTGRKTIPVFWLADEDHDFDEVASLHIPAGNQLKTVTVKGKVEHPGASVSRIQLQGCFGDFVAELKELLPDTDFSSELFDLLESAYADKCSFKNGFARILSKLFSKYGLIFAGSDHAGVKSFTSQVLRTACRSSDVAYETLTEQSSKIAEIFHAQANIQDSLLFHHDEQHGRQRIRKSEDKQSWCTDHTKWEPGELEDAISREPEVFSPNVFLRSILQDALLPNLAYIAGPGEIAYYAQMKTLYGLFGKKMPIIVPRLSATVVESSVSRITGEIPFALPDYQKRIEDLESEYLADSSEDDLDALFDTWKKEIDELTDKHVDTISKYDASLKGSARKITIGYHKSLDKLSQKLRKSLKQREETQLQRIRKIKQNIFPNDNLQEREVAIIYFLNKYGLDLWDSVLNMPETENVTSHKVLNL